MLKFEEIRVENAIIKSISDIESPIPKSFHLIFSDDELQEESIPKLEDAIDKYDFEIGDQHILFQVNYDELLGKYIILMDVAYWYLESKGDSDIPDVKIVENIYRPIFEDFYKKSLNKFYK